MEKKSIPVEISARHVHLTEAHWIELFGQEKISSGHLLSQPPQFVASQRIILRGPKGDIDQVAIVGPFRDYTQAELAMTDARRLGLTPPLSDSGKLEHAAHITIVGPAGEIRVPAAIIQKRHLHISPELALANGVQNQQKISLLISGPRGARLDHVLVRTGEDFTLQLHLDTDEANACGITSDMIAEFVA